MQFAVSAAAFSMVLSIYLYIRSLKAPQEELAPGGNSGELEVFWVISFQLFATVSFLSIRG